MDNKKFLKLFKILGIENKKDLEENDLDFWHQKRYIEIQKSGQDKKNISKLLIELNNAKETLDQFDTSSLLDSLLKKEERNYYSSSETFNKKDSVKEIKYKEKYNFMKKYGKQKVSNKSRISENESISRFVGLIFFSGFICLIFGYYLSNEIALENFIKSFEEFDFGSTVVFLLIILICVLGSIEFKKFKKKKVKNFFNLNK